MAKKAKRRGRPPGSKNKKSIGKSKKFVADAKQELVSPGSVLNGKSLMVNAYNSCVGIYY